MKSVQALLLVTSILMLLRPSASTQWWPCVEICPRCPPPPCMLRLKKLLVEKQKFYDLKDPIIKQGMLSIALLNLSYRFKPSQVYVYLKEASTNPSLYPRNLDLTVQIIQKYKSNQSQDAQCQMNFYFPISGMKLYRYSCIPI